MLECGCRLLGLVLGANLGFDGGVTGKGERFLVLETDFFLSFLVCRWRMRPRLLVCWAYVTLGATGQVDYGFLIRGCRGKNCNFSGDTFVDTKCEPGTLISAKLSPNDELTKKAPLEGHTGTPLELYRKELV